VTSPSTCAHSTAKSSRLADWTTLKVGGPAERLAFPESVDEVREVLHGCTERDEPWRVLGRGSNLIVSDEGVPGTVIHTRALRSLSVEDDGLVVAGAGLATSVLLADTRRRGLGGLESLVGYPATVGGAARMNAGGRWGETGDRVVWVTAVTAQGRVLRLSREECGFAYRSSELGAFVVVEVALRLPRVDPAAYQRRIDEIRAAKGAAQPLEQASAGCVFRNPSAQVSAGWLVDACGLRGSWRGGAQVSEKHANFVVNARGATAADVMGLILDVREEVARQKDVRLDLEVEWWGANDVPGAP